MSGDKIVDGIPVNVTAFLGSRGYAVVAWAAAAAAGAIGAGVPAQVEEILLADPRADEEIDLFAVAVEAVRRESARWAAKGHEVVPVPHSIDVVVSSRGLAILWPTDTHAVTLCRQGHAWVCHIHAFGGASVLDSCHYAAAAEAVAAFQAARREVAR